MQPLEHRYLAGQGTLDVASRHAKGRRAISLQQRADLVRSAGEQRCPAHLEEAAGVVVDVDELSGIDVEHHDRLGSMLHQRPVAAFAFAHRYFGEMPLGDVADADDIAVQPIELGLADGNLNRDPAAAFDQAPGLRRGQVHVRIVNFGGETLEVIAGMLGIHVGEQQPDRPAENLGGRIAEDPLAGVIEGFHAAGVIDRDDRVLDVVENGLQVRGCLLANLASHRLRLIGHQLHRAHDAAPFGIEPIVMRTDGLQELIYISRAAATSRLRNLLLQQRVEAVCRRRWLAANGSGGIA